LQTDITIRASAAALRSHSWNALSRSRLPVSPPGITITSSFGTSAIA
jgi:hypothetical protein